MTIASEISKLQENLINAYSSIESKGGTLPVNQNFDNLSSSINTITGGSSNIITATNNTGELISKDDKVWINEENGSYKLINPYGVYYTNFNTVGSPTIDYDNGFVNNFSDSNGIVLPEVLPMGTADNWEFVTKVNLVASPVNMNSMIICQSSGAGDYGSSGFFLFINYSTPTLQLRFEGDSEVSAIITSSTNISTNTFYWFKVEFTGTAYNLYMSTDGMTWNNVGTYSSSRKIYQQTLPFRLGSSGVDRFYFNGTIFLSDTYIKINNEIAWNSKTNILYDNFTKNGSPIINQKTGIVSGFSGSNYLKNDSFDTSQHWEVNLKTRFSSFSSDQNYFSMTVNGFSVNTSGQWCFYLSSTNGNFDIANNLTVGSVSTNVWYWIRIVYDGSKYEFYVSTDGDTYSLVTTINTALVMKKGSYFWIGNYVGSSTSPASYAEIDLSATNIKVNDSIWWKPNEIKFSNDFNEDILTGFANEDISNNSSGQVRALLS